MRLPYYILVWLPKQTYFGISSALTTIFNVLSRWFSRGWDLWWDAIIWLVTRPYAISKAIFGTNETIAGEEIHSFEREEKDNQDGVKLRRRRSRSAAAAKTGAAIMLADGQKAEGALIEESDSGIDSADEVDTLRDGTVGQKSKLYRVTSWLSWPFYFLVLTLPTRKYVHDWFSVG